MFSVQFGSLHVNTFAGTPFDRHLPDAYADIAIDMTTEKLLNGTDGAKAVEVLDASKTKVMAWKSHLCGVGLENSIKQAVDDHLDEQGAMTAAARKKKATNIRDQITVCRKTKECAGEVLLMGSTVSGPARSKRR